MQNVKIKQLGIKSWTKGGINILVNSDILVVAHTLTSLIIISSIIIQTVFSPGPILVSAYQDEMMQKSSMWYLGRYIILPTRDYS